jgi:hypothetical protein
MELINATKFTAGYTMGMDPDGREHVVVVVKGTYRLPREDCEPELAAEQAPLVMADEFTGKPGMSATIYESDYPLYKPRCDVLLNGSAHAPDGRPTTELTVGLRVGAMQKSFSVTGPRVWERSLLTVKPSDPRPFTKLPISYGQAYGGCDVSEKNPDKTKAYVGNPVGTGYYPLTSRGNLIGKPLPVTSELGTVITTRKGKYPPMAFGAIGRNFAARFPLGGTYDQEWLDNVFPFLPADFDPLYHQSAPPEQQIEHPRGGEKVVLVNVSPQGRNVFRLPTVEMPVEFTNEDSEHVEQFAALDTIIIEPDLERLLLVWRTSVPLRRDIFEMKQCVVGRMSRGWYRARSLGKTHYPSLRHLTAARED